MRNRFALTAASVAVWTAVIAACGSDSNGGGGVAPGADGAAERGTSDAPSSTSDGTSGDAGTDTALPPPPKLSCSPAKPAFSIAAPPTKDDAWDDTLRIVRLSPTLARVVAHLKGRPQAFVYSFDPTSAAPEVTSTSLTLDFVLEIQKAPTAIDVLGLRIGTGTDAGPAASLVLYSIDDASGVATELPLTVPGALLTPQSYRYEPPMGRFARIGPNDVYFAYTEEVPPTNNPTYRFWVGRVTEASGPVVPTLAASDDAHDFAPITAAAVFHAGSKAYVMTGACGVPYSSSSSDTTENATTWILPDDGTVPANVEKKFLDVPFWATGLPQAGTIPMAFIEEENIFNDDRYVSVAFAPEADPSAVSLLPTHEHLYNHAVELGTEAHFEGTDLLMFGRGGGWWYDGAARAVRTSTFEYGPLPNGTSSIAAGAITLVEKSAEKATIDLALVSDDLWFEELSCVP